MKTLFLFFLATFCATSSIHCQDSFGFESFFGRESTVWNGMYCWHEHCDGEMLSLTQDTIINGIQYKKIEAYFSHWDNGEYFEFRDEERDFFLREDSVTGKLWCRYPYTFLAENPEWIKEESLIVDMRLSIGDTFEVSCITDPCRTDIYIAVDTATIDRRHIIKLRNEHDEIVFIEGVGCTNLFDYCMHNGVTGTSMRCCHKDGELVYHNSNLGGGEKCAVSVAGIGNPEKRQQISVYPNPCTDKVWISGEDIVSVTLLDVRGNVLKKNTIYQQSFDVSFLPKGIYILCLIANNIVSNKYIVKN